jgi:tetratricopeptide (TPR) repeat protein
LLRSPSRWRYLAIAVLVISIASWFGSRQFNAWRHFEAGKRALAMHHHGEALFNFRSALQVWGEDGPTCLLAAQAARLADDFDAADGYLKVCQALPAQADDAALERVLLRACQGDLDSVNQYCLAMLEKHHSQSPRILEALALGNLRLLRFAAADQALDRWLEITPDEPQAVFLKGRLQLQAANNTEALDLLRHAIDLDSDRDEARLLLAGLQLDLGQPHEALPHLERVCKDRPGNSFAQARFAQALILLGRSDEAIPVLDDVLARNPNLSIALIERGKLALRDGDLAQAERWLGEACQRDIGDRAAHYQYLQCLKQMGKTQEARAVQGRLDAIDTGATRIRKIVTVELPANRFNPDLQAELGELLLDAGLDKDGIAWLNRALQIDPNAPRAHRAFAKYYQSLGQDSLARQHLAAADATELDATGEEPLQ